MLFGDGLRLSDEPLESFLAALFLQFLPDHIPAGQVVVVEPVALQEGERRPDAFRTMPSAQAPCAAITRQEERSTKPFHSAHAHVTSLGSISLDIEGTRPHCLR